MKNIAIILFCLLPFVVNSQIRNYANPEVGLSYNADNQSQSVMPLLQQADRHFRTFDYEESFFALENAVAQNPNSPEALLLRAKFKKTIGMSTEAQIDYEMAHRLNPYVADLYGYNGAEGLYNLLAIAPENTVLEISSYSKLNFYHEELDQHILNNKITSIEVEAITYAIRAIESDQLTTAVDQLDIVLSNNPTLALAVDLRGLIYYKENNPLFAQALFQDAKSMDPQLATVDYNLGVLELADKNYEKAEKLFSAAISKAPNFTKAYFDRAVAYKAQKKLDLAIADYDRIIQNKGELYVDAYVNRGLTKKMSGDINGAFMDLHQIVKEFPYIAELRKNMGNLYLLFGLPDVAIEQYSEAIDLDDNYAEAYYNRALAHFQYYDKVSGCADLETSKELDFNKANKIQEYFCTF